MQKRDAFKIIILFGLISLFGDMAYEASRSVNGPYLKTLGVNAAIVGLVVGLAEFLGYAIRLVSGYLADKTKNYWLFTFIGYGLIISVPLLSLAGTWQFAVIFIILERLGKALRSPAKDTILSCATKQVGTGFGFGLHEVFDQIGAIAGPLIFACLFLLLGRKDHPLADYQRGYSLLWIPFILMILCLGFTYARLPHPEKLEPVLPEKPATNDKLTRIFWLYTIFTFLATLGFTNFALIGYHFKTRHVLTDAQIPLFYAIAMAVDALVALIIGKTYDIFKAKNKNENGGLFTLIIIPIFSLFIPILAFSESYTLALSAAIIWGIVMGSHETIMKSAVADLTTFKKRGTGYGIFNTAYGLAMFIGASLMGLLYEKSLVLLIIFSIAVEITAIFAFFLLRKVSKQSISLDYTGSK